MSHGLPRFLLSLLALSWTFLTPAGLFGQDLPQFLRIKIEPGKEPANAVSLAPVNLRPNTATTVGLYLQNISEDAYANVKVKLVQLNGDQVRTIAEAEVQRLPGKDEVRLAFPKGKEGKDGPEKLDLVGPPFRLQLWIEPKQPKDFAIIKRNLDVVIREPRDYISSIAQFDKNKNRLSFKVKLDENENLIGPQKCPVELVLGAEFAESKKGVFKQVLTEPKQTVELFAEDVAFADKNIREGRVYLTVDGYQRAFIYPAALVGSGDIDEAPFAKNLGARISVPRYSRPAGKFLVPVEIDGPIDADYRVEVGFDRTGTKEQFHDKTKFAGLRQQKVRLSVSPAGDLICQTEVSDWKAEFDTTGVFGDVWFRVNVLKKDRKTALYEEVELTYLQETRLHLATLQTDARLKGVFVRATLDDSAPEGLEFHEFVDLRKEWIVGKPLPVVVKIRKREAHQAPIDRVIFFRGKAPPDGKINPDAVIGNGDFDPKKSEALIVLPAQDKTEPLELSALFTTRTGVSAVKTASITFKPAEPPGKGLAKIKGKLTDGLLSQPNKTVTLADEKGNVKATAKSDINGVFIFEKVPPGNYVVISRRDFPALIGQTKVTVPEGKDLVENVVVRLIAK